MSSAVVSTIKRTKRVVRGSIAEEYPGHVGFVVAAENLKLSCASNKLIEFLCGNCGVVSASQVRNRTRAWDGGGAGCPLCWRGKGSLAEEYPEHTGEVVNSADLVKASKSHAEIEFRCPDCTKVSLCMIGARTNAWDIGNTGCGLCRGHRSYGSLEGEYPEHMCEIVNTDDRLLSAKSHKKIPFRCPDCGQVSVSYVYGRTNSWDKGNTGCYMVGCKRFRNLAEEYPNHVDEIVNESDRKLSARCNAYIDFKCPDCGAVRTARVSQRTMAWDHGNTGCPCTGGGYNPFATGWLYLLSNDVSGLLQIGITNDCGRRLAEHARNGFAPLDVEKYDGVLAAELEAALKKFLVNTLGHPLAATIDNATFDGYTESWDVSELCISKLSELRSMLYDTEFAVI
jgi:DNA-directed RNA polymerase subunit M/transcription elongation factor TFIIS